MYAGMLSHFSHVRLCATPRTAAHQAPLSTGFSRQGCWSGLPFPFPLPYKKVASTSPLLEPEWVFVTSFDDRMGQKWYYMTPKAGCTSTTHFCVMCQSLAVTHSWIKTVFSEEAQATHGAGHMERNQGPGQGWIFGQPSAPTWQMYEWAILEVNLLAPGLIPLLILGGPETNCSHNFCPNCRFVRRINNFRWLLFYTTKTWGLMQSHVTGTSLLLETDYIKLLHSCFQSYKWLCN